MSLLRVNLPTDADRGPARAALVTVSLMVGFLVVVLLWMGFAEINVSVNASGSVVPPSSVQQVQSLEGGIVRELLVKPGSRVKAGDVLVRLDEAQYQADRGESRQNWLASRAAQARLDGLLSGQPPLFDAELQKEAPALVQQERRAWEDGWREYQAALSGGQDAVRRDSGAVTEARARIESLKESLAVAQESLAIEDRLQKAGAGARADYLNAQQRYLGLKAELDGLQQSLPRLEAAVALARSQGTEAASRMRAQWATQRSELQGRAQALGSVLEGREDRLARRELTAPIDGTVNRVLIPTRGGVAQAGAPILEIVPDEKELRLNVRVKPADIGFIRAGQTSSVRVVPYDSSIYGKLDAVVDRVGADAVLDENRQPYFEVGLVAPANQLQHHGKPLPITPGMPVDASILTGERTVLQYLLKPMLKSLDAALQER